MRVSVIGLGKLGASMVAGFASRGFKVVGVDINQRAVDALNNGLAPVEETDMGKYISHYSDNITATVSYEEAIASTDISFVIVPTPSLPNGSFSLEYAKSAFADIGKALKGKLGYHVVVLTSTVLPGSTRGVLIPIIEKLSGKTAGVDFGICYNPEFIALGSVIRDFLNPDFYLLGEFDTRSGDALEAVHNKVSVNHAQVKRMSIENAELAKISINSYVTLKISYANMLSLLCEKIPNGDIDIVSDALGMDSRIGRKYLTGGTGFAGPCFPRDNVALNFFGDAVGTDTSLLVINHEFNNNLTSYHMNNIKNYLALGMKIAVLGLSYKENSYITEESEGLKIAKALVDDGFEVVCHDAFVRSDQPELCGLKITNNLNEIFMLIPDLYIVCTCDPSYINLPAIELTNNGAHSVILIDMWRKNKHLFGHSHVNYVPVGINITPEAAQSKLSSFWLKGE